MHLHLTLCYTVKPIYSRWDETLKCSDYKDGLISRGEVKRRIWYILSIHNTTQRSSVNGT